MRIVVSDEAGIVLVEKTLKGGSSNVAELWAVAEAMPFAKSCGITDLTIYTDSRNTLAWLDGRIGKKLNDRVAVMNLLLTINGARRQVKMAATWIPREQNIAGIYIEESLQNSLGDPAVTSHNCLGVDLVLLGAAGTV